MRSTRYAFLTVLGILVTTFIVHLIFLATPALASDPSLIGYWTMDDAQLSGSTLTDLSAGGHNGTLHNGPVTGEAGVMGQSIRFAGTTEANQYVDLGTTAITSGAITISAWVKRPWSTAKYASVFSDNYTTDGTSGVALFASAGATQQDWAAKDIWCVGSGYGSGRGPRAIGIPGAYTDNTWHLITCVLSTSTAQIYVDGAPLQMRVSSPAAVPSTTGGAFLSLTNATFHDYMDGSLDDVRIYNRALSPDEITALFQAAQSAPTPPNTGSTTTPPSTPSPTVATSTSSDPSLLSYWPLDIVDGSQNTPDASGNNNTGHLFNSPTLVPGMLGLALQFNGSSSFVETPNTIPLTTGAITIAAWVKRPWSTGKYAPILSTENYNTSSTASGISLMTAGGNNVDWQESDLICFGSGAPSGHAPRAIASPGTLQDNTWHHVVCVLGPTTAQIYVDGASVSMRVSSPGSVPAITSPVELGAGVRAFGDFQDGALDDVLIYNRALSASEVTALYQAGQSTSTSTPPNTSSTTTPISTPNGNSCPQATNFLARTSGLDTTHVNAYTDLICGLVSDGVWPKLDVLYMFATQNLSTSLLNLINSNYTGVTHYSMVFTADKGWAGDGGDDYIDSQFNPSTAGGNYSQNAAHLSAFVTTSTINPHPVVGYMSDGEVTQLWPGSTFPGDTFMRINDVTPSPAIHTNTYGPGFYVMTRTDASTRVGYFNDTSIGTVNSAASGALANADVVISGDAPFGHGDALFSDRQIASVSIGGALTAADEANVYSRIHAYLAVLGVVANPAPIVTPPPSTKFSLNDRVQTSDNVNVRSTPSAEGTLLDSEILGALGTIIGGSISDDGFNWWNISYDNGTTGWSAEDFLTKYTAPQ